MSWRMRTALNRWRKEYFAGLHDEDSQIREAYEAMYIAERDALHRAEVDDAKYQGKMKAIKEQSYRDEIADSKFVKDDTLYWVTVNPKDDVELLTFISHVEKYVRQKHVDGAEYVYEQRGDSEATQGKGMHVHMLVKTNTKPADFKKRTFAKFKGLVGNDKHVWVTPCPSQFLKDKRAYMQGHKTGAGKDVKCEFDTIWRRQNCLQSYYIVGNAFDTPPPNTPEHSPCPSENDASSYVEEESSRDEPDSPVHSLVRQRDVPGECGYGSASLAGSDVQPEPAPECVGVCEPVRHVQDHAHSVEVPPADRPGSPDAECGDLPQAVLCDRQRRRERTRVVRRPTPTRTRTVPRAQPQSPRRRQHQTISTEPRVPGGDDLVLRCETEPVHRHGQHGCSSLRPEVDGGPLHQPELLPPS